MLGSESEFDRFGTLSVLRGVCFALDWHAFGAGICTVSVLSNFRHKCEGALSGA